MDSDIYKVLEAIGWELGRSPDEALASFLGETTALLEKAQRPDGYLNSFIQVSGRPRYSFLASSHELYCAGHLIQAGLACQRGAGDPALLAVARRFEGHLVDHFLDRQEGIDGHRQLPVGLAAAPGHRGRGACRPDGARPVQRVRGVNCRRRDPILLRQPAAAPGGPRREGRSGPPPGMVQLRLLPAEHHAHDGLHYSTTWPRPPAAPCTCSSSPARRSAPPWRGPLVYCLEQADQPAGVNLADLALTPGDLDEEPATLPGVGDTVLIRRPAGRRPAGSRSPPLPSPTSSGTTGTAAPCRSGRRWPDRLPGLGRALHGPAR